MGDQLRRVLREAEGVGDPQVDVVRVLGRLQVEAPPDQAIQATLREIDARWSGPMMERRELDFSRDSLVYLLGHVDAVEAAVDDFVVGGSTLPGERHQE